MKVLYGKTNFNNTEDMNKQSLINLKYYKIKSILTSASKRKYGIQVVKKELNGRKIVKEKSTAKYVSSSEQAVERLLEILLKNKVTPVATSDVLADFRNSSEVL